MTPLDQLRRPAALPRDRLAALDQEGKGAL
jgi:hypothetical protein